MGNQSQELTVPNITHVKALKTQICGAMRCGVVPKRLEIRLGNITLEDPMPLHYYGIKNGSAVRPFVNTTIQNNHGAILYTVNKSVFQ